MATEPLEELWGQWQQQKLEQERAIGQMLQHLLIIKLEIERLKRRQSGHSSDKKAEA
jgi:hypothetical protein